MLTSCFPSWAWSEPETSADVGSASQTASSVESDNQTPGQSSQWTDHFGLGKRWHLVSLSEKKARRNWKKD